MVSPIPQAMRLMQACRFKAQGAELSYFFSKHRFRLGDEQVNSDYFLHLPPSLVSVAVIGPVRFVPPLITMPSSGV